MAQTVLLTLGRLPKALDLARGFAEAGCRVLVAEPFAWHLCRVSRDVSQSFKVTAPNRDLGRYLLDLREIVVAERVDLVVPVSEEVLHAVALKADIPPGVRFFAEDRDRLLALHDKQRFIALADSYGLAVPQTHRLGTPEAAALARRRDVVIKPIHSCSGQGLRFLTRGSTLPRAEGAPPAIVQSRIDGRHLSTFSLAQKGRTRVSAIYEGTVFSGSVAVAFQRVAVEPAVTAWVESFIAQSGFSGFISFDFIAEAGGPLQAIECNPRVTSGLHYLKPADLARAILEPEGSDPVGFRPQARLQQFFPCLTETQASIFKGPLFAKNLRALLHSRDVTWRARDPWPLLLMTFVSYEILRRSIFDGQSFGEAATLDIAWFGEESAPPTQA